MPPRIEEALERRLDGDRIDDVGGHQKLEPEQDGAPQVRAIESEGLRSGAALQHLPEDGDARSEKPRTMMAIPPISMARVISFSAGGNHSSMEAPSQPLWTRVHRTAWADHQRPGRRSGPQVKPGLLGSPMRLNIITTGHMPVKEACTRWAPRMPVSQSQLMLT